MKEELSEKLEALTDTIRLENETRQTKQSDCPKVILPNSPPPLSVKQDDYSVPPPLPFESGD